VITAGVPVGRSGTTNLIKVHHVGEMIAKGQGIGTSSATGQIVVARTPEEANRKMIDGAILVTVSTDKDYIPAFQRAAAVITETGGITSHAAVVGLSLGIPVIVGVDNVFDLLKDGLEVSIYPEVGVIYSGKAKVM
jgi:pyruvate kinase